MTDISDVKTNVTNLVLVEKKYSDVAEMSNTDIFEERKLLGFKVSYDNIMFAIRSSLMDPSN